MLNFIKMDFYRLLRQKSTWILLLIVAAVIFITIGTTRLEQSLVENGTMPEEVVSLLASTQEGEENDVNLSTVSVGMNVNPSVEWMNPDKEISFFELAELTTSSGMLTIIVVIFAVIFGFAERKNGYIKNLVGRKHFKAKLYFSKIAVVAVYTVVIFVIAYLMTALLGLLLMKNPIDFAISGSIISAMLGQLLTNIVIGLFTILLVTVFEGTTVPIVVGSLISMGVLTLIYSLVDKLVYKLFDVQNFVMAGYFPSGQIKRMVSSSDGSTIANGFIVLLIFMVIYLAGVYIVSEKKDIN